MSLKSFALLLVLASSSAFAQAPCPIEGRGGDPELNRLKNRTATSSQYASMTIAQLASLPMPRGVSRRHRSKWPSSTLAIVSPLEKKAVTVEGRLVGVSLSGPEACNCKDKDERDFHLWLAPPETDEKADALVVEVTPRVRAENPAWSLKNLRRFVESGARIRISGLLFLDPEHPEQLGKTRRSLWEVHPILRIEVFTSGIWRAL